MHLVRYREAIDVLMATPPSLPQDFSPDVVTARTIIGRAVADGRSWLDPIEIAQLLACYSIPIVPVALARNADEAAAAAAPFLSPARP